MDDRVISIGALSSHELWDEKGSLRTAHATTTLIRSGDRVILVDPGLPSQITTKSRNVRFWTSRHTAPFCSAMHGNRSPTLSNRPASATVVSQDCHRAGPLLG